MPLYPLPGQESDPFFGPGKEKRAMLDWVSSRLRDAQQGLAKLRDHDPNGLLPGSEAVVADMLSLKAELESLGFTYTIPDHLKDQYDEHFAPRP